MNITQDPSPKTGHIGQPWLGEVDVLYNEHHVSVVETLSKGGVATKKVNISGFEIEVADEAQSKIMKEKLITEAINGSNLRKKMQKVGIEPIAVLPEDVFTKIVDKAGFYTFSRMTPEGKVYGNGKELNREHQLISDEKLNSVMAISLIVSLCTFISLFMSGMIVIACYLIVPMFVVCLVALWDEDDTLFGAFIMSTFWWFAGILFFVNECIFPYIVKQRNKAKAKNILWPKKNDIEDVTDDLFQIILPAPPDNVKVTLKKCYDHQINTFLVIDERAFQVVIDKKKLRELYAKWDPIICHKEDGMVAVLEQFGDFPEEKEVIQFIQEHFDAVRKDLLPSQLN